MSEQNNPKQIRGIRFSFLFKLILVCLSPWLFYGACGRVIGLDDAFYTTEGKEAIQKISELSEKTRIPIDTVKNADYAHYAKNFMPADPNFHYRFEIDRQVLASFIKKKEFISMREDDVCIKATSHRTIGDWWQPSEIKSKTCFKWNENSTDYSLKFNDVDGKNVKVYIFGYNN